MAATEGRASRRLAVRGAPPLCPRCHEHRHRRRAADTSLACPHVRRPLSPGLGESRERDTDTRDPGQRRDPAPETHLSPFSDPRDGGRCWALPTAPPHLAGVWRPRYTEAETYAGTHRRPKTENEKQDTARRNTTEGKQIKTGSNQEIGMWSRGGGTTGAPTVCQQEGQ
ncbi:hypothetical protein NDU88_002667 [Pleurodeles waltl]|uniref:Uncharacterized protein n=1 Tax=Pleurodeles waltl TaxID=8319 RepID=A0AAV7VB71_PLEWA|nr:hypothetical protein NDU88_002667 [Pleurodeles waltl]